MQTKKEKLIHHLVGNASIIGIVFLFLSVLVIGCKHNAQPLSEIPTLNPEPPYQWYPFDEYPLTALDIEAGREESSWNVGEIDPKRYRNRFFDHWIGDLSCLSVVEDLTVNTSGSVTGNLSFNTDIRMQITIPGVSGGNTQLGGYHRDFGMELNHYFFKYEVVIRYSSLIEAFYGQLISEGLSPSDATNTEIVFKDDYPANDWNGLNWSNPLPPGKTKADYAVFEVIGNTVRWIDAPQSDSGGKKKFVMVYAGACGVVTHMKIFEISYSSGNEPTIQTLSKDQFRSSVKGWSYR